MSLWLCIYYSHLVHRVEAQKGRKGWRKRRRLGKDWFPFYYYFVGIFLETGHEQVLLPLVAYFCSKPPGFAFCCFLSYYVLHYSWVSGYATWYSRGLKSLRSVSTFHQEETLLEMTSPTPLYPEPKDGRSVPSLSNLPFPLSLTYCQILGQVCVQNDIHFIFFFL